MVKTFMVCLQHPMPQYFYPLLKCNIIHELEFKGRMLPINSSPMAGQAKRVGTSNPSTAVTDWTTISQISLFILNFRPPYLAE